MVVVTIHFNVKKVSESIFFIDYWHICIYKDISLLYCNTESENGTKIVAFCIKTYKKVCLKFIKRRIVGLN